MERCSAAPNFFTLDPIAQVATFLRQHQAAFNAATTTSTSASESRKDKNFHSGFWPLRFYDVHRILTGVILLPALPPFPYNMSFRGKPILPGTPRIISPSPTPSDGREATQDAYSGPMTRSATRKRRSARQPVEREPDEDALESPEFRRARTRSRSPMGMTTIGKMTAGKSMDGSTRTQSKAETAAVSNGKHPVAQNGAPATETGHLAPPSSSSFGKSWSWRDFSRSPSPLGLIPIHRHWRIFIHKHEVPRKALHVSIGFFVVLLYLSGTQAASVCPYLLGALIPIAAVDVLRHHYPPFNSFYVKVLGALMRENEYMGYNGVIFYLLGAWIVLNFFPKDVGVVGTLLLSWCDTAASTFGRLYGQYTPRIRRGKSVAGSLAAFLVGVGASAWFWGWLVPTKGPMPGDELFMFTGSLHLPQVISEAVGLTGSEATISGRLAVGVLSVWSGLAAAASEMVDFFGLDDNLTIPVLSGLGIWGFLKIFG